MSTRSASDYDRWVHVPRATRDPVAPSVATLGAVAAQGALVICAGAGVSKGEPTALTLGSELAGIVYASLRARLGEEALVGAEPTELLSVADTVEALPGGAALLQTALLQAADYSGAEPNYAHVVLALLLLDGAAEVLVTNYDDCIERGGGAYGRLQAIVSDADRIQVQGPAVLKVHGCATRAGTLLASTQQLEEPPTWVFHHFGERLGTAYVVFVGLGDVAAYVRIRIAQLLERIGNAERIWVAATSLPDAWTELVPDIENRFIEMSADDFLDQLLRDYVRIALERFREIAGAHQAAATYAGIELDPAHGAAVLVETLVAKDAAAIVSWLRSAAMGWPAGESVVHSTPAREGLLALALGSCRQPVSFDGRRLILGDERVDLLLARSVIASSVAEAAQRRFARERADGRVGVGETVTVVCHGHQGPLPNQLPVNVIPGEHSDDIVDGPNVPLLRLVSAHRVLEGELPAEWAA
jgi:hypothetical protein